MIDKSSDKSTKMILALVIFSFLSLLNSCSDNSTEPNSGKDIAMKIAIFSDPHYYETSLGVTGDAFQKNLMSDRKLIAESSAITESVVNSILAEKPDLVIVCGDLTKDGELINHQKFAGFLKKFRDNNIKVYVIPGNHDINNPLSFSYSGNNTTLVPNISKTDFSTIYNDYGFSSAIAKDPNSLTYIVEPTNGVWLFCIDACRYSENVAGKSSVTAGKISTETEAWITTKLQEAKTKGKLVFGAMHHGILEHFTGQSINPFSSEYVVENYSKISTEFASLGMKVLFSGHFHANDIVSMVKDSSNFLYDIETGSVVTSPCPYRIINLTNDKKLDITTKYVSSINFDLKGNTFNQYAKDYLKIGMDTLVYYAMVSPSPYGYGLPVSVAKQITPVLSDGFISHYAGDESLTNSTYQSIIAGFQANVQTKPLGDAVLSLWIDLPPSDNNIIIDLNKGTATKK